MMPMTIHTTTPILHTLTRHSRRLAAFLLLLLCLPLGLSAQIGEHRNTLSVGVNGGYNMTTIRFTPKVVQKSHGGLVGGLALRYTVEKYFSTIASVVAEVNYGQMGWSEDIRDLDNQPVINAVTGMPEEYSRTINYVQVPFLAHLAWGKERKGMNFFVSAGPQFGYYLSESTKTNFAWSERNMTDRANTIVAQDTMAVENKVDYGITVGAGLEYSHPRLGHFLLEARYYYGLGNIYGDSKRDYFGSSNFGIITIKMSYLFDITR